MKAKYTIVITDNIPNKETLITSYYVFGCTLHYRTEAAMLKTAAINCLGTCDRVLFSNVGEIGLPL